MNIHHYLISKKFNKKNLNLKIILKNWINLDQREIQTCTCIIAKFSVTNVECKRVLKKKRIQ